MMRSLFTILALGFGLAQTAGATIITVDVVLDPTQVVPAPTLNGATPAGTALVEVDTTTNEALISGDYSGMTSDVIGAHLHGPADIGEASGVVFGFATTGGTTGTFVGSDILSLGMLEELLLGMTYIQVHTLENPPGEIRGQVIPEQVISVPEPAMLALIGIGLAMLGAHARAAAKAYTKIRA